MIRKLLHWLLGPSETDYERGVKAAMELCDTDDVDHVLRQYDTSFSCPDQTDFDVGYRHTIRTWLDGYYPYEYQKHFDP